MTFIGVSPPPDEPSASTARQASRSWIAHGLLLTGSGAAMALAGFASQGNLGIFLLFAGAALVLCPPTVPVHGRWWLGGATLLGLSSCALLPAHLIPGSPAWRSVVSANRVISLPLTYSPAPQETLFWLALLLVTIVLGLFILTQPLRSRTVVYLVLLAIVICGLHAAFSMYAKFAHWRPPLVIEPSFGTLPNRNHTAILLVTGSILSLGLLNVAVMARRWIILDVAIVTLVLCAVAVLFYAGSRAGVIFLLVGILLWLSGFRGMYHDRKILLIHVALLLSAAAVFLAFQSVARDRLLVSVGWKTAAIVPTPAPVTTRLVADPAPLARVSEPRIPIWRDALRLVADAPLTGIGLGTFTYVFPQYRRFSLNDTHTLHPESDWLLFIAEAGLPAFLCLTLLLAGLVKRLIAGRTHPYWPLRWTCAVAALTAILHGAVDVPAHRAALGWWILELAGLGLSLTPGHSKTDPPGEPGCRPSHWHWQRAVFLSAGIGALVFGGLLIRAEWFGGAAFPPFAVQMAPFEIARLQEQKNYAAAELLARRTIRASPLFDQPYFWLGVNLAAQSDAEGTDAVVDEMFQAQRILDPITPSVPLVQGGTWSGYDPVRETAMYLDSVARQGRIDQRAGRNPESPNPAGAIRYFGEIVATLRGQPDTQRYLLAISRPDARFAAAWLVGASPELARAQTENIGADRALLLELNQPERQLLRSDWYVRGEMDPLISLLPGGRGDAAGGWPVRLRQTVNARRFEQAVGDLSRHFGIDLLTPLETATDPADDSLAPVRSAWQRGDFQAVRRLLDDAGANANDQTGTELLCWRAALAAHDSRWYEAWLLLESYVRHSRQTAWP